MTARAGFGAFVATYVAALGCWAVARNAAPSVRWIVVIAIAFRVPLLFAPPHLSGDVYRYLWDGIVSRSGVNPYRFAPDAPQLATLRPEWHPSINHPEIRTIYPPVAEALFAVVPSLVAWRIAIAACDLGVALLLARRSRRTALAYVTLPLVLFEGVWSAHVDAVAGAVVAAAFIAGIPWLVGLAGALKIIPLAAAPAAVLDAPRRWRAAAAIAAVVIVPLVPFALAGPLMPGLSDYAERWAFNSPAFSAAQWIASVLPLKDAWTAVKGPLDLEFMAPLMYRLLTPELIARAILATVLLAALWLRRRHPLDCIGALLLLSPTIHPWYWLTLAALALHERSSWIAIAVAAPLSYLLYAGAKPVFVMLFCYGVPLAWLTARLRISARAS